MAKRTFELIYSQQSTDYMPGKAYANPRHFSTPREGVTKVYLVGDWPLVREAYEAIDVPVEQLDEAKARCAAAGIPGPAQPQTQAPASLTPTAPSDVRGSIEIPADWKALPWTAKGGAPSLRSLASKLSETPVLNKAQGEAAIEAELARRAAAETEGDETEGEGEGSGDGEGEGSGGGDETGQGDGEGGQA